MSYCRFGRDSDVYVIYTVDGLWECCGCPSRAGWSVTLESPREMLLHLAFHHGAGHKVPNQAMRRLRVEARALDAGVPAEELWRVEEADYPDPDEDIRPATGVLVGLGLGFILWAGLFTFLWAVGVDVTPW